MKVVVLTTSYPRERAGRGRSLRPRRGRGGAGAGRRGRGRLAGVVPALRDRVRARDRREPAPAAVAGAAAAGVPLQLRAGGATGGARRRPRPRALAAVRARGAQDREAVRRPALGHGRRARAARAVALPAAAAAGAACDRRAPSTWPTAARELGAREVRVVPSGVEIPESVGEPDEPPHVLFVGRLSPEKGIHEFLAATEGLPRVIVGAGPVEVPEAVGFVPRSRARPVLRARRGRLRPVAPRGLRRRRARGDGLRPTGGGDARSAASST